MSTIMNEGLLPTYSCHKQVKAAKIARIQRHYDKSAYRTTSLYLDGPSGVLLGRIEVSYEYVTKHDPKVGGYYVRYDGGYESWSPAEAFESGYTIEGKKYE